MLQRVAVSTTCRRPQLSVCCNLLQCVAVHCSVLQWRRFVGALLVWCRLSKKKHRAPLKPHVQTKIHTYTHTFIRTNTRTHAHTRARAHTHTHKHTHAHTQIHTSRRCAHCSMPIVSIQRDTYTHPHTHTSQCVAVCCSV